MPTTPTRPEQEQAERTAGAWATYSLQTAGLEGGEYEEAESQAWERLQRELEAIAASSEPPM
jgi:hypothetical protein